MIVFIWLRNKNGYWFHINSVRGGFVDGYALIQSQWIYQRIPISRIYAYY